jgi:hypothetical protein
METTGAQQNNNSREDQMEEFPTCYIEEEILEELDSQEAARAGEHFSGIDNENAKGKQERHRDWKRPWSSREGTRQARPWIPARVVN